MADRKNEKILIIVNDYIMGGRIEKLLINAGFDVRKVNSSYAAITALEGAESSPFALVISAYKIPRMNGDDLLEHARFIAPDTQRMLLADVSDMAILINAINRAAIHSCVAIPFKDEQLMSEVLRRCDHFRRIQKRESLRKLTEHQNRQMYKLALQLKKKETQFKKQIEQKNQTIINLMVEQQSVQQQLTEKKAQIQSDIQSDIQVDKLTPSYTDNLSKIYNLTQQDSLLKEFKAIAIDLKKFLQNEVFENTATLKDIDELTILNITDADTSIESAWDDNYKELIDTILTLFFQNKIKTVENQNLSNATINTIQPLTTQAIKRPTEPVDATIKYFFDFNGLNRNKKKSFVLKNTLLAEKTPCKAGIPGIDIAGNSLLVREPYDPLFTTGVNTKFADDKLKIIATADGHPHVDFMGTISVFPELHIKGDVNFNTGNVSFVGNIKVDGVVKSGCIIKCASLTAQAVEGAHIHLTGDLHVSLGIVNTNTVTVQGNVQAGYIKNARIKALGDISVQKEIIDSELFVGGECINKKGIISSSFINSRKGIVACKIGGSKSSPSKLEVGTEGIIEMMIADLDERIARKQTEMRELKDEIADFESEEKILHANISDAVYVQEFAQNDLRAIEKQLPQIEASEDISEVKQMLKAVKELKDRAEKADKVINKAFERQDAIVRMTLTKQSKIDSIENEIKETRFKQRGLKEFASKNKPIAEVHVSDIIMAETLVVGLKSKLLIKQDLYRCKIYELPIQKEGMNFNNDYNADTNFEMVASTLKKE